MSSFRLLQLFAIAMMLGSVSWLQPLTREGRTRVRFGAREAGSARGDAYETLSSFRPLQFSAIAMMPGSVSLRHHLTRGGVGRA